MVNIQCLKSVILTIHSSSAIVGAAYGNQESPQKSKSMSIILSSYTTLGYAFFTLEIHTYLCIYLDYIITFLIYNSQELVEETMKNEV